MGRAHPAHGAEIRLSQSGLYAPHLHRALAGPDRHVRRNTHRLITVLRAMGVALGGNAGARLAARLRLPTSPATVLHPPALPAVGVGEWAGRRGHRDGTIVVHLADHRVADLLPDRSAASVAAWLAQHPTITVVCRDRSDRYADGSAPRRRGKEAAMVT
jgi:Transposase